MDPFSEPQDSCVHFEPKISFRHLEGPKLGTRALESTGSVHILYPSSLKVDENEKAASKLLKLRVKSGNSPFWGNPKA